MSEDEILFIAEARCACNESNPSTEHFGDKLARHVAGVRGEVEFADWGGFGYESIRDVHPGSDGGSDFKLEMNGEVLSFDVKTRDDSGLDLLVKAKKFTKGKVADYFVLAYCIDKRVRLRGWEDAKIVRAMPISNLKVGNIIVPTHIRRAGDLRPMWFLKNLLRMRDREAMRA